jgi:hypothetical protein
MLPAIHGQFSTRVVHSWVSAQNDLHLERITNVKERFDVAGL